MSFMSNFAAFAIKASGFKKRMKNPVSREKYISRLSEGNKKPFRLPAFPYHSLAIRKNSV